MLGAIFTILTFAAVGLVAVIWILGVCVKSWSNQLVGKEWDAP